MERNTNPLGVGSGEFTWGRAVCGDGNVTEEGPPRGRVELGSQVLCAWRAARGNRSG